MKYLKIKYIYLSRKNFCLIELIVELFDVSFY